MSTDIADLISTLSEPRTSPADDVAVRVGIELRESYSPEELRPEHVPRAIEDNIDELKATGAVLTCSTPRSGC